MDVWTVRDSYDQHCHGSPVSRAQCQQSLFLEEDNLPLACPSPVYSHPRAVKNGSVWSEQSACVYVQLTGGNAAYTGYIGNCHNGSLHLVQQESVAASSANGSGVIVLRDDKFMLITSLTYTRQ